MLGSKKSTAQERRSEIRERLQALARTVSGNDELRLDVSNKPGHNMTDCKRLVSVTNPEAYEKMGFSEDDSLASSVVNTVHEGAHIKAKSDTALLSKVLKRLEAQGADKTLSYLCLDCAEDLRVDARMSEERPGYGEMLDRTTKAYVTKMYKPTGDPRMDAMKLAVTRLMADVDISGKQWNHVDPKVVDALVKTLAPAAQAKSCEEALRIGYKAYRRAFKGDDKSEGEGSGSGSGGEGEGEGEEQAESGKGDGKGGQKKSTDSRDRDSARSDDADRNSRPADDASDDPSKSDLRDASDDSEDDDGDGDGGGDDAGTGEDPNGSDAGRPDPGGTGEVSGVSTGAGGGSVGGGADAEFEAALKEAKADPRKAEKLSNEHILAKLVDDKTKKKLENAHEDTEGGVDHSLMALKTSMNRMESNNNYERPVELINADRAVGKGIHSGMVSWFLTDRAADAMTRYSESVENRPEVKALRSGLTRVLAEELRKAKEPDTYLHKSGVQVHASKVWRATKLNRPEVMIKKEEKSPGGWHVDIWVDGSGSNSGSRYDLQRMLTGLIGAFRDVGIDCRAFGWHNEGEHLLITRMITTPSEPIKNVLRFNTGGDNRDGHAVRVATELLKNVNAPHKLLIWISDGLPSNDAGSIDALGGQQEYHFWVTPNALYDTATALREARKHSKVLGILIDRNDSYPICDIDFATGQFIGSPKETAQSDLAAMIYGRDFVNVKVTRSGSDSDAVLTRIPVVIKNYLSRLLQG